MRAADQRQQRLRLSLHSVKLDYLDGRIFRQPEVSLLFSVPLVSAQNEMLFHDIAQTVHLMS